MTNTENNVVSSTDVILKINAYGTFWFKHPEQVDENAKAFFEALQLKFDRLPNKRALSSIELGRRANEAVKLFPENHRYEAFICVYTALKELQDYFFNFSTNEDRD